MELNKRKRDEGRERAQSQRYDEFLSKKTNKTKRTHCLYNMYYDKRERESVCVCVSVCERERERKDTVHSFVICIKERRNKMILSLCLW